MVALNKNYTKQNQTWAQSEEAILKGRHTANKDVRQTPSTAASVGHIVTKKVLESMKCPATHATEQNYH